MAWFPKEKKVEEKPKEEPKFAGYISKIQIGNSKNSKII